MNFNIRNGLNKLSRLKRTILVLSPIGLALLVVPVILLSLLQITINTRALNWSKTDAPDLVNSFLLNQNSEAKKIESNKPRNFLLLGIDSTNQQHTDSIVVLKYDPITLTVNTVSMPRDLLVNIGNQIIKLNSVRTYSPYQKVDINEQLETLFATEFGLQIDGTFIINMKKLSKIIDYLGGIPVEIERTFRDCNFVNDFKYPEEECVTFKEGLELMNGKRAAIFARSRTATDSNEENCDPARNSRQSVLFMALLKTIVERLNYSIQQKDTIGLVGLMHKIQENIDSSLSLNELVLLAENFANSKNSLNFKVRYVLQDDNELICRTDDLEYSLILCRDGIVNIFDDQVSSQMQEFWRNFPNSIKPKKNLCSI